MTSEQSNWSHLVPVWSIMDTFSRHPWKYVDKEISEWKFNFKSVTFVEINISIIIESFLEESRRSNDYQGDQSRKVSEHNAINLEKYEKVT